MLVTQSCPTLCDPVDCIPPGSSVRGLLQARILEWVATPFSRGSSQLRHQTRVSHTAGRLFTVWVTREALLTRKLEITIQKSLEADLQFSFSCLRWPLCDSCLPSTLSMRAHCLTFCAGICHWLTVKCLVPPRKSQTLPTTSRASNQRPQFVLQIWVIL